MPRIEAPPLDERSRPSRVELNSLVVWLLLGCVVTDDLAASANFHVEPRSAGRMGAHSSGGQGCRHRQRNAHESSHGRPRDNPNELSQGELKLPAHPLDFVRQVVMGGVHFSEYSCLLARLGSDTYIYVELLFWNGGAIPCFEPEYGR